MQVPGSGQWARIKELVADGLELEPAAREAFLERLGDESDEVRQAVRRLLSATSAPTVDAGAFGRAAGRAPRDFVGRTVGAFRVERFLGRGGMGEVYGAVQEGTGRRVAVKLLAREGELDRLRFEREGRLLGRLEHPHIAQVIAAAVHVEPDGTEWPFLALELVEGLPITEHARVHRLDAAARASLVVDAALAVDHAHRAGIVHRDLKPENLLVRAPDHDAHPHGDVRVLDFGVAALVGDAAQHGALTTPGDVIGTLQYMAPEQAEGRGVDPRSDVHGLGVVLFELLTGRLPFERAGSTLAETLERIQHEPAPSVASLEPALRGDLDTIVATALAKEPERRYASCAALAADLRRFLESKPIAARPTSRLHRARLVARRHKGLVIGSASVLVVLVAATVVSGVAWLRAAEEARHANDVADFLGDALSQAQPEGLGHDVTVAELLEAIAAEVDPRFGERPRTANRLDHNLGWAFYGQGEPRRALELFERAAERARDRYGATELVRLEPEANAAIVSAMLGDDPGALLARIEALVERARAAGPEARVLELRLVVAKARALDAAGRMYEAIPVLEEAALALEAERARGGEDFLAEAQSSLSALLHRAGETRRALEWAERLRRESAQRFGDDAPETLRDGITVAVLRDELGEPEAALADLEALAPKIEAAFGAGSPAHLDVLSNRAAMLSESGANARAAEDFARVVALSDTTLGPHERSTLVALNNLAFVRYRLGEDAEAERLGRLLVERARAGGAGVLDLGASANTLLAALRERAGDPAGAVEFAEPAATQLDELLGPDHARSLDAHRALAGHRARAGDLDAAAQGYRALLERCRALAPERNALRLDAAWQLAGLCLELEALDEAEALLAEVDQLAAETGATSPSAEQRAARAADLTARRAR